MTVVPRRRDRRSGRLQSAANLPALRASSWALAQPYRLRREGTWRQRRGSRRTTEAQDAWTSPGPDSLATTIRSLAVPCPRVSDRARRTGDPSSGSGVTDRRIRMFRGSGLFEKDLTQRREPVSRTLDVTYRANAQKRKFSRRLL